MAIDNFEYTHPNGWEDTVNFPTTPANETQTRQLLQIMHKEVRDYLKNKLVPGVNAHLADFVKHGIQHGGTLSGAIDYHNIEPNRIYQVASVSDGINPPPTSWGILVAIKPANTSYGVHLFFNMVGTPAMYIKPYSDGNWKKWRRLDQNTFTDGGIEYSWNLSVIDGVLTFNYEELI